MEKRLSKIAESKKINPESAEKPNEVSENRDKFDSKEENSISDTNTHKEEKKRVNAKLERNKKLDNLLNDDDL